MEITISSGQIDLIAIYAAIVATLVLVWDIVKWWRKGARLYMRCNTNMIMIPDSSDQKYIVANIANNGDLPTTLQSMSYIHYSSKWPLIRKRDNKAYLVNETSLPYILRPGEYWQGMSLQDEKLEKLAEKGCLFCEIHHSGSRKPTKAKVTFYSPTKR